MQKRKVPSDAEVADAALHVPGMRAPEGIGEVWAVLDAVANGDDPVDCLEEHRFWRSALGRAEQAADDWDSGRPRGLFDR